MSWFLKDILSAKRRKMNRIIDEAAKLEDGETGMNKCLEIYCAEHGIDDETCEKLQRHAFIEEAVSHGIPRSVAEGRTQLSDHFSQDYIDWKCGREPA